MKVPEHPNCKCNCHTDLPIGSWTCDKYGCDLCIEAWTKDATISLEKELIDGFDNKERGIL